MIVVGLTGSLATGKSTVSKLLRLPPYQLPVIDADVLAREVVAPGTKGFRQVVAHFHASTPHLLGPDDRGPIDRAVLGRRVFGAEADRKRDRLVLNGIIHPLVRQAMLRNVLYYYLCGHRAVILDIPLLFEGALDTYCSIVLMIAVSSPQVQMQRLRNRDQALTKQEAEDRVASQMSVKEKTARTRARGSLRGKIILNDDSTTAVESHVAEAVNEVFAQSGSRLWTLWLLFSPCAALIAALWEVYTSYQARTRWEEKQKT